MELPQRLEVGALNLNYLNVALVVEPYVYPFADVVVFFGGADNISFVVVADNLRLVDFLSLMVENGHVPRRDDMDGVLLRDYDIILPQLLDFGVIKYLGYVFTGEAPEKGYGS